MKKILSVLCAALLLSGCAPQSAKSGSAAETEETQFRSEATVETAEETVAQEITEESTEETTEEATEFSARDYVFEIPEGAMSSEEAGELLLQKLQNYGYEYGKDDDRIIAYEGKKVCENREYYSFHDYYDYADHTATMGWYLVDPSTGACFDNTTELLPLFYRFDITESGVEVYDKYAYDPFQVLNVDPEHTPIPEWLYETYKKESASFNTPYDFIDMIDLDFDGYDDIILQVYLGAYQGTFQYYRFDPDTKLFEEWTELNELHFHAKPDVRNKTLSVFSKSGAVDSWNDVYKWSDGELVKISSDQRYKDYETQNIYMDHLEYDDYGNETLVKREKYILDENKKVIGTEEIEIG
ncbi:MAG: membrane lipoprotein lipid attachment site-containing protein [Clostridium sp.]|nr:membrane lipoprotein lipid attachment site-containing protein [Clostridium sp.]MCM1547247.1 membrane lipoprotein lipid attachment site-containing protein [Ruminococcus sp.]